MRTGRPSKLTPDRLATLESAIQAGNYFDAAAAYAGIGRRTLYEWLKRGRDEMEKAGDDDEPSIYVDLVLRIERALGLSEVNMVALIQKAASVKWVAAAWWLERKFPSKWGQKIRTTDAADEIGDDDLLEHEAWLKSKRTNYKEG